jgi:fructokinase
MPAVVCHGPGRVEVEARPTPTLRDPHDVLIRVRATGICGTDRAIVLGEFPARPGVILGHESVGEVVGVGTAVRDLRPGDRVVPNPTFYCGQCRRCRRGLPAHCERKEGREIGVDSDGTMADHVVLDDRFVHAVPPDLPYRRAVLVEPLACVLANLEAAAPRWDDRILVAGAGPIGALAALTLAARGARVTLVERDPERVRMAAALLPKEVQVVMVPTGRLTDAVEAGAPRPDVVIDTTGVLLGDAVEMVARGGTVVVMGEKEGARATVALRRIATRGIRMIGAGPYPPHLFQVAVELATELPMESLVTHELPLSRITDGFELLGVNGLGVNGLAVNGLAVNGLAVNGIGGHDTGLGYRAGKVLVVPEGGGPW